MSNTRCIPEPERQVRKMIRIEEIAAEDTFGIRKSILREGMKLSHEMKGDHDADTLHLGLYKSEKLISVASFMQAQNPELKGRQYQLRGMATTNDCQGKGYGKMLLNSAEQVLKAKKVDVIWCNARLVAIDFYKKMGYGTKGSMFEVAEVGPHYVMYKEFE